MDSAAFLKLIQEMGVSDYSKAKELSGLRDKKELVSRLLNNPEVGKKFDHKAYKIEEFLKAKGFYYI
jgi:hypothetical protein